MKFSLISVALSSLLVEVSLATAVAPAPGAKPNYLIQVEDKEKKQETLDTLSKCDGEVVADGVIRANCVPDEVKNDDKVTSVEDEKKLKLDKSEESMIKADLIPGGNKEEKWIQKRSANMGASFSILNGFLTVQNLRPVEAVKKEEEVKTEEPKEEAAKQEGPKPEPEKEEPKPEPKKEEPKPVPKLDFPPKSNNINIYIIDTGVDSSHTMIPGVTQIYSAVDPKSCDDKRDDIHNHGTYIAYAASKWSNSGASIKSIRISDCNPSGYLLESELLKALSKVQFESGGVIVLSLRLAGKIAEEKLSEISRSKNIPIVISGGNYYEPEDDKNVCDNPFYSNPDFILVGSTYDDGTISYFSAKGDCLVYAPGIQQRVAVSGGKSRKVSDSAISAGYIAGLVADIKKAKGDWSVADIKKRLLKVNENRIIMDKEKALKEILG